MTLKIILGILLILCSGVTFAQLGGSPEKSAFRNIEKHRWQKAEDKLRKSLGKDTLNPSVRYTLSVFFFHQDNPAFHLDSAYHYAVTALGDYGQAPARERDRLRRMTIDSLGLIALRAKIDSTAFEVARAANTEVAYLEFLSHFPLAMQRDLATELRDEVAFQDALSQNTHQAFLRYLERYPQARRAREARARYDRLLFMEETKDQRLTSFEQFLADHPETPYRKEIFRNIFEISTADGTVEGLRSFMSRYPSSDLVKQARQMIFHILVDEEEPHWPVEFLNDSLQNLLALNDTYLVPFLKNDRYGFMDRNGHEVIGPVYKNIHADYLCGNITDEVLIVDNQLVARNGSVIFRGPVSDLTDLGLGFLKVQSGENTKVIHKAGFVLDDSVQDARTLGKRFLGLKKNNSWFLYTLTGRLLDRRPWDDLTDFQDLIIFTSGDKKSVAAKTQLGISADGHPLALSDPFEEIKQWPQGLIWGRSGEFQGVINQSLHTVIRFDKHGLEQTFFGAMATIPQGYALYNWQGRRSSTFEQIHILGRHVGVRKNKSWFLFDPITHDTISKGFDSLKAEGPFVLGLRADSVYIHFAGMKALRVYRPRQVTFIPGKDSTSFLILSGNSKDKAVYDLSGRKLFSASFDDIEYAGQGIFVVTQKKRKGLVNMRGQTLLAAEFDAAGSVKDEVISVLKDKKFGAYHIGIRKLIKPQYDRNLIPYSESIVTTFKDGFFGFIGWDNKPVTAFEFEEVRYWNDSLALVRKGSLWSLFDIPSRKVVEINLKSINMVSNSTDERIAIVQKDNNFGVLSNLGKKVIPITFSEIINLGSGDVPLYFTERHIPEASLYIVIYYDQNGLMLRKEIYDDAADYDKIYCSDQ